MPTVAVGERLGDEDAGDGGLLGHDAAELLGDAEHADPELERLRKQLGGRGAGVVGGERGGAELLGGEGGGGLAQHLLLVVE